MTRPAAPLLSIRALRGSGIALESLALAAGECVAIGGPSGAGKSRLLRAIADLDPCDGDLAVDGQSWRGAPAPWWRRRVALVPSESGWWSERVADHFEDRPHALALAASFGLPATILDADVSEISTGERQRLALARALSLAPRVALLDEPTSALDAANRDKVAAVLRRFLDDGAAIVLVTHDPALARQLASRSLTMSDGHITGTDAT